MNNLKSSTDSFTKDLQQTNQEIKQQHESKRRLPHSKSDFLEIVSSQYAFVDKTNFIKEVIDSEEQVIMITRPPAWGKSINLSMLNYFFKIELNKQKKPNIQSKYRALFEGGDYELKDKSNVELNRLSIANDSQWHSKYSKHQGKYPVIFMSLESIMARTQDQLVDEMKIKLSYLLEKFPEMFQHFKNRSDQLSKGNKKILLDILDRYQDKKTLSYSLSFLVRLLNEIHNQKVVVLIDDYDSPYMQMVFQQLNAQTLEEKKQISEEKKKVLSFLSSIIRNLMAEKDKIEKVILTGVFDTLNKQNIIGLSFAKTYGILDTRFSSCFGFTLDEIEAMVNEVIPTNTIQHRKTIMENMSSWYNGFAKPPTFQKQLFNPYSAIMYLNNCSKESNPVEFQFYQRFTRTDKIIEVLLLTNNVFIEKLLQFDEKNPKTMLLGQSFGFAYLNCSQIMENQWSYLFISSGYLTGKVLENKFEALIPNQQFALIFQNILLFSSTIKNRDFLYKDQIHIANISDLKIKMLSCFKEIKQNCVKKNQSLFHCIFLCRYLFCSGIKTHYVSSQFQSGFGKIDTIFFPKNKQSKQIILQQYKFIKTKNQNMLSYALWQIYIQNYLKRPLYVATKQTWIKNIIIRPIIIIAPKFSLNIQLQMEDIVHSIEQAEAISSFFELQRYKFKNSSNTQFRKHLMGKYKIQGIKQLLKKILQNIKNIRASIQLKNTTLYFSNQKQKCKEKCQNEKQKRIMKKKDERI